MMTVTLGEVASLAPQGHVGVAMVLALVSTGCYASSAVLQEREASRSPVAGAGLVWQLVRRPWWWAAVVAAGSGAALHVAALAFGPLSLVQPIGVMTLVLALPLGARLAGRMVTAREWRAGAAVALGLGAVLLVAPHHAPATQLTIEELALAATTVTLVVLSLVGLAARVPWRFAPVIRAAAAATCFGFASGMARVAAVGAAPLLVAATMAAIGAAAGLGLAQLAYRAGGLGAPLATQILVDPMVAVLVGITLLEEHVLLSPGRAAIGGAGLVATATGIWALTRPHRPDPGVPRAADEVARPGVR